MQRVQNTLPTSHESITVDDAETSFATNTLPPIFLLIKTPITTLKVIMSEHASTVQMNIIAGRSNDPVGQIARAQPQTNLPRQQSVVHDLKDH